MVETLNYCKPSPSTPSAMSSPSGKSHHGWVGEDVHLLAAAIKDRKEMSWVCRAGSSRGRLGVC